MCKEIGKRLPFDSSYPEPLEKGGCLSQKSCEELLRKPHGLFLGSGFLRGMEQSVSPEQGDGAPAGRLLSLAAWAIPFTSRLSVTAHKMERPLPEGRRLIKCSPEVPGTSRFLTPGTWLVQWKEQGLWCLHELGLNPRSATYTPV